MLLFLTSGSPFDNIFREHLLTFLSGIFQEMPFHE